MGMDLYELSKPASSSGGATGSDSLTNESTVAGATVSDALETLDSTKASSAFALNDQTGTSYAPVLSDNNKLVTLSNAAAITVTLPANASVAFPIGTCITWCQKGAGQVTFGITSDTLNNPTLTAKTRAQWSMVTTTKISSTVWVLSGDLAAA